MENVMILHYSMKHTIEQMRGKREERNSLRKRKVNKVGATISVKGITE